MMSVPTLARVPSHQGVPLQTQASQVVLVEWSRFQSSTSVPWPRQQHRLSSSRLKLPPQTDSPLNPFKPVFTPRGTKDEELKAAEAQNKANLSPAASPFTPRGLNPMQPVSDSGLNADAVPWNSESAPTSAYKEAQLTALNKQLTAHQDKRI